jgi:hypothetical protein
MDIERLKELRQEVFGDYRGYTTKNLKDEDGNIYPSTIPLDECCPTGTALMELIDEAIQRRKYKEIYEKPCDECKNYENDFYFCPYCGLPLTEV